MRLKDISLVSQGMQESKYSLDEAIDSAKNQFNNSNTLANQAIDQSQLDMKNQIKNSTDQFASDNYMVHQGIDSVKSGLKNQIDQSTSPFKNNNILVDQEITDSKQNIKNQLPNFKPFTSLFDDVSTQKDYAFDLSSLYKNDSNEYSLSKQAMLSKGIRNNRNFMESLSRL